MIDRVFKAMMYVTWAMIGIGIIYVVLIFLG